jgi:uncharacterized cupin superfamily protein
VTVQPQTTQAAVLDAEQVLRGPLPDEISMEPVTEGVPFAYEKKVFDGPEGLYAVWACGPGVFPRVKDKRGSFMYILSGAATMVDQDGTAHELTAGSVLVLPFGYAGTWHIREPIRKVYLHTTPVPPLPGTVTPSAFAPASQTLADTVVFDGPDGRCDIRSRAPGLYTWVPDDHGLFAYVLGGDGFRIENDGTRHVITPGSAIALPSGWSGTWDIRSTLRAFWVRSTPAPA